jgi:hypothetical protein
MKKNIILKIMICFLTITLTAETESQQPIPVEITSKNDGTQENGKSFWQRLKIKTKERLVDSSLRYAITVCLVAKMPEISPRPADLKTIDMVFVATYAVLGIAFIRDCIKIIGEAL